MSEYIEKYVGNHDPVRAAIVINSNLVEDIRLRQKLTPIPTLGLGRAVTGALLLASNTKAKHKVGLQFQGAGPIGNIYAEANYEAQCRGCTGNPSLVSDDQNFDLQHALGLGVLTIFNNMGDKGMYQGRVELKTSEIGDDIAYFLYQSQQIPSLVSLGLYLDSEGKVQASGGIMIELMPGHSDALVSKLEANATSVKSVSEMIRDGATILDIKEAYLHGIDMVDLNYHKEISFKCECNEERVKRSLMSLDPKEYEEIQNGTKKVNITCEFCGKEYHL